MGQTLYRKYRPQLFADVVEQTHIVTILRQQLKDGSFSHAYLFSGPRGTGKTTLARIVAKRLNCLQPVEGEPCNLCESCLAINENRSLDFIEIDAASNRGINEIRELKENVKTGTSGSNYKVFVIDEVHMLTNEAFNALLKTLEEPPQHAVFVLATTELHKIPDTIISRCQQFRFGRVSLGSVLDLLKKVCQLEKVSIEDSVLKLVARRSGGYVRDALSLLSQLVTLANDKITEERASLILSQSSWQRVSDFILALLKQDGVGAMRVINLSAQEGLDLEIFVVDALEFTRLLTVAVITNNWDDLLWLVEESEVNNFKQFISVNNLNLLSYITDVLIEAHGRSGSLGVAELPLQAATAKYLSRQQSVVKKDETPKPPTPTIGNSDNQSINLTPKKDGVAKSVIQSTVKVVNKIVKKEEKEAIVKTGVLPQASLEEVVNSWPLIINDVRRHNQTLSGFLQTARPESLLNGCLTISFSFGFHWDKLREPKNLKIMLDVLTERWAGDWNLLGVLSEVKHESIPLPTVSSDGHLINDSTAALEVFAGQMAS